MPPPYRTAGLAVLPVGALGSPLLSPVLSATVGYGGGLSLSGTPPTATQGVAYSWTPITRGGVGPYTYSIIAGTLPTGFSLNTSTGTVSGTDSTAETRTGVGIRVVDSTLAHADLLNLTFVVAPSANVFSFPLLYMGYF